MTHLSLEDKENSGKLSNHARSKNPFGSSINPFLVDSQKKFEGTTYSEMKRNRLAESRPMFHEHADDPQWNIVYTEKHINKMYETEKANWRDLSRMVERQKDEMFPKARAILLDYLVYFHKSYKIKDENTFYKAVQILDAYLEKVCVIRKDLQLVGSACMMIAEKYEEIYPQPNSSYVRLAADSFTKEQLKE